MHKIALIGNGYWGNKILKYIPEFFDLKYIADSKSNLNQIWKDKEVNSVIIATPIQTHYKLTKEALQNGKNVYVEKPITIHYEEALELKELANRNNLKLAVEYTQMFSPTINKIKKLNLGKPKYIEASTKHLGRYMGFDVYWLLASHQLSVLDMFEDLDSFMFIFNNILYFRDLCSTGTIICENNNLKAKIDVSLDYYVKEFYMNFYYDNAFVKYEPSNPYPFSLIKYNKIKKALPDEMICEKEFISIDESNNIRHSLEYFKDLIENITESNVDTAIKITKILEKHS